VIPSALPDDPQVPTSSYGDNTSSMNPTAATHMPFSDEIRSPTASYPPQWPSHQIPQQTSYNYPLTLSSDARNMHFSAASHNQHSHMHIWPHESAWARGSPPNTISIADDTMSKLATASAQKIPTQLPKSAWERGPPNAISAADAPPSTRLNHPRRSCALGLAIPIRDGTGGAVKQSRLSILYGNYFFCPWLMHSCKAQS
jgi:hypothetical protein